MEISKAFRDIQAVALPLIRAYRRDIQQIDVYRKEDNTLLTPADEAIQRAIIEVIRDHDRTAQIVAEEDVGFATSHRGNDAWIVDPIDGTSEFVSPSGKEFCIAVCVVREGMPAAALVVLPELGLGNTPIVIEATTTPPQIWINNALYEKQMARETGPRTMSATRSANTEPRPFEAAALARGCTVKTRTTSQTTDLVRVATDLTAWTEPALPPFDLFYRQKQKLWDGAPGICLNLAAGYSAVDAAGRALVPFPEQILTHDKPTLATTVVGSEQNIAWFFGLQRECKGDRALWWTPVSRHRDGCQNANR